MHRMKPSITSKVQPTNQNNMDYSSQKSHGNGSTHANDDDHHHREESAADGIIDVDEEEKVVSDISSFKYDDTSSSSENDDNSSTEDENSASSSDHSSATLGDLHDDGEDEDNSSTEVVDGINNIEEWVSDSSSSENDDDTSSSGDESIESSDYSNCSSSSGNYQDYSNGVGDDEEEILTLLERNDPSLTQVCIHPQDEWFPSTKDEWFTLGQLLGQNSHITELSILNNMDGEAISPFDEYALYSGLQYNRHIQILHFTGPLPNLFRHFVYPSNKFWRGNQTLTNLSLNGLELVERDVKRICSVVKKLRNLDTLEITHCWSRDGDCWFGEDERLFSIFLRVLRVRMDQQQCPLKRLELQGNGIGVTSMNNLAETIQRCCPYLEELNLQDSRICFDTCNALVSLLRDESLHLSCLDLWRCSMNDDCALLLTEALKRNKSLRSLRLGENNFTEEGWKVFSTLLCDRASIAETFGSNHTLECLGGIDRLLVDNLLDLNLSDDKRAVAMNKVVQFHLDELLAVVEVKVLPNIMSLIGANQENCSEQLRCDLFTAMFRIVRNSPELFQYVDHSEGVQSIIEIAHSLEKIGIGHSTVADLTLAFDRGLSV